MSDEYRKDPRLNASTLKLFAGDDFDPAIALHKMANPSPPSAAMQLGTAVHAIVEHLGQVPDTITTCPFDSYRTKEAKAWKEANGDKIILKEDELEQARIMAMNVLESPMSEVLHKGQREVACYKDRYKALFDVKMGPIGLDVKTTNATSPRQFMRDAFKFLYHLQAWHYSMVGDCDEFYFVAVSSVAPYPVWTFKVTDAFDLAGEREWRRAQQRYDLYRINGIPEQSILDLDPPKWAVVDDDTPEDPAEDFSVF